MCANRPPRPCSRAAPPRRTGWAGAPAHVGRPFPQQTLGACATPSPRSAAAPTGLRMRPRSSQPAARPRLQPRRTAVANKGCQRSPGAPPWSSEASARSEQAGPAAQAAGSCSSGPRAARRPAYRADYKSHEALRPGLRRLGVGRGATYGLRWSGKGPHPARYHKLSRIQPLEKKSINIYLIQSFLIHTVDGPPPRHSGPGGRYEDRGQMVTRRAGPELTVKTSCK